jgi:hypothetical protein
MDIRIGRGGMSGRERNLGLVAFALAMLVFLAGLDCPQALLADKQIAEWLGSGTFAEYTGDDITWLLVANDTTSQGTLTRNNDSRIIFLNQSSIAHFKWTCLSKEEKKAILNLSLQFPPPLGGVSAELQLDLLSRQMVLEGTALGEVPFWTRAFLQTGQSFGVGASPEPLTASVARKAWRSTAGESGPPPEDEVASLQYNRVP